MIIYHALIQIGELSSGITPLVPYYHTVSDERLAHICHVHPYKNERQFADDIDFLCQRYHPLSLDDLIAFGKRGKRLKKGSFILTFDDGYSQCHSVVAPALFKKGIPAIFFLSSDFVDNRNLSHRNKASIILEHLHKDRAGRPARERVLLERLGGTPDELAARILAVKHGDRGVFDEIAPLIGVDFREYLSKERPYLSSAQVREMIGKGFHFGAHGIDHPYFPDLSGPERLRQALDSLRFVRDGFGLSYSLFAFPHSDMAIGWDFFHSIESDVDLTFGTCGIKKDPVATNIQRINFERTLRPACQILARQFVKKMILGRSRDLIIRRDHRTDP